MADKDVKKLIAALVPANSPTMAAVMSDNVASDFERLADAPAEQLVAEAIARGMPAQEARELADLPPDIRAAAMRELARSYKGPAARRKADHGKRRDPLFGTQRVTYMQGPSSAKGRTRTRDRRKMAVHPGYLRWVRPFNVVAMVAAASWMISIGIRTGNPLVQQASYWMAVGILLRMLFHESGHFAVAFPYRALAPNPDYEASPRVQFRFGPLGAGWGFARRRFSIWISPYAIVGAGRCLVSGESRFPPWIRAAHILAGPLAEIIPSTAALITIQALPNHHALWGMVTLLALTFQGIGLSNLVAHGTQSNALSDGAEMARLFLGLTGKDYVAQSIGRRRLITAISSGFVVALLVAEAALCGFPPAEGLQFPW